MEFTSFKNAVAEQFKAMADQNLFVVDVDKDLLWNTYLDSYPEGTNLIFKERREYDCSCCRSFVKSVGNVVSVSETGEVSTIWDISLNDVKYQVVADAMAALVRTSVITNIFLTTQSVAGVDKNFEQLTSGEVRTWEHFFVNIPNGRKVGEKNYTARKDDLGGILSDQRATYEVLLRGLTEITMGALDTVIELVSQNSLYRGQEFLPMVKGFRELKVQYAENMDKLELVWLMTTSERSAVCRIRNSAIGTLLQDLSRGEDLESAVKAFESIVAPTNYKRTTALVTQAMVDNAKTKIAELGLLSALERRHAVLDDIDVTDILFIDRSTSGLPSPDDAFNVATKGKSTLNKVEEISIADFLANVLPLASTVEVMVENRHDSNLMSLTTAVDPTAGNLFKWDNPFAWSYNGDVTDSIKERVKKAGGDVSGELCCRLSWFNRDDLDLSMVEPDNNVVYFANRGKSRCGGRLDVDMNVRGETREPVENIYYTSCNQMRDGKYELRVHNFTKRETVDVGFVVEIEYKGETRTFAYDKPVRGGEFISVATMEVRNKEVTFTKTLPMSSASKVMWGLKTQEFTKVNLITNSPNHWGKEIGNKHVFFILDKCAPLEPSRGLYNEYLREDLNQHRKVFELVGGKILAEPCIGQLSGIGFSTTQRNSVLCRVTGKFSRTIKILI